MNGTETVVSGFYCKWEIFSDEDATYRAADDFILGTRKFRSKLNSIKPQFNRRLCLVMSAKMPPSIRAIVVSCIQLKDSVLIETSTQGINIRYIVASIQQLGTLDLNG